MVKSLKQIDSARFVQNSIEKAQKSGVNVVTLRDNGNVSPQEMAAEARKRGLFCEINGLTVKMAVVKTVAA